MASVNLTVGLGGNASVAGTEEGIISDTPVHQLPSNLSKSSAMLTESLRGNLTENSLRNSGPDAADTDSTKRPRFPTDHLPSETNASDTTRYDGGAKVGIEGRQEITYTEQLHTGANDDNPWSGRAILALDGGGIRGLASLLTLQKLMGKLAEIERNGAQDSSRPQEGYRPHHYFDLIGGTSTGGLIAIMLGRLRMTVDEALEQYQRIARDSTRSKSAKWKRPFRYSHVGPKNAGEIIEQAFSQMPPEQSSSCEKDGDFSSDPDMCKTVLCSMTTAKSSGYSKPALFRSYSLPSRVGMDADVACKIWEVARATSAAPSYFDFKPYSLGGKEYVDAAPFLLNPSWQVYNEFVTAYKGSSVHIELFLSIGSEATSPTSKIAQHKIPFYSKNQALMKDSMKFSDIVDRTMRHLSHSTKFWYGRVNVETGKPLPESLEESCQSCLATSEVKKAIEECAIILVKMRKRRQNTMLWERFADGVLYRCPLSSAHAQASYFSTRVELKDHLQVEHGQLSDPDHHVHIQGLLDKGRKPGKIDRERETRKSL